MFTKASSTQDHYGFILPFLLKVKAHVNVSNSIQFFSLGIDKDLISTVHGTTNFALQLIRQHVLYRDAIAHYKKDYYPLNLFEFNEELLNRKQSINRYKNFIDSCNLPQAVSKDFYDTTENRTATRVQRYFKDPLLFYNSLIIGGIFVKTVAVTYGKLVGDCCISFYFDDSTVKYGLILAIVKSSQNTVRLFIEELVEKTNEKSKFHFKLNDQQYQLPNVYRLVRSNVFHLKHPQCLLKKNAVICQPGGFVTVLEYPNLKDSS